MLGVWGHWPSPKRLPTGTLLKGPPEKRSTKTRHKNKEELRLLHLVQDIQVEKQAPGSVCQLQQQRFDIVSLKTELRATISRQVAPGLKKAEIESDL
jgi:hypothetical protein